VIREVVLRGSLLPSEQRLLLHALSFLQCELACDAIRARGQAAVLEVCIGLQDWAHAAVDIMGFDRLFASLRSDGEIRVVLWSRDWLQGTGQALELLTRYQHLLPLAPDFPSMPGAARILAVHELLYSQEQPYAWSSYEHSLDTWRWLLRLEPEVAAPVQLAALFHDLGACQRGGSANAGKHERALASVRRALRALEPLALDARDLARMADLMIHREADGMPGAQVLNDADSLSFFSLSSWHYLRQHGVEETRRKVAQTLSSMSNIAVCLAVMTRQPPAITEVLDGLLGPTGHDACSAQPRRIHDDNTFSVQSLAGHHPDRVQSRE
jgi:hypothetical protein